MDLITIEGLRLRCVIGCKTEERRDRFGVVVDLTVGADAAGSRSKHHWKRRTSAPRREGKHLP
jgi:dihydroneopterin aldolase